MNRSHRSLRGLYAPGALLALAPLASAQIYVDPAAPPNGTGTLASPLSTITDAVAVAPTSSVIYLLPGEYSSQTGEVFPIVLDRSLTLRGRDPRGASLVYDAAVSGIGPALLVQTEDPVLIERFSVEAELGICIKGDAVPSDVDGIDVLVRDMELTGNRSFVYRQDAQDGGLPATSRIRIWDSRLRGGDEALRVIVAKDTLANIELTLDVERSHVWLPVHSLLCTPTSGVNLGIGRNSSMAATFTDCAIHSSGNGLRVSSEGNSTTVAVQNCSFWNNGVVLPGICGGTPLPSQGGSIVEDPANGRAQFDIANSLFFADTNANVPYYNAGNYVVTRCAVEDTVLSGVGGSFFVNGDPYIEPSARDFHLRSTSNAIDAADQGLATATDLDGDPRDDCTVAALRDIGADERVEDYVYFVNPPNVGASVRLRILTAPNETIYGFFTWNPFGTPQPICSSPYQMLSPQQIPGVSTQSNAHGVGVFQLQVPNDPVLAGASLDWGVLIVDAQGIPRESNNLHMSTFR